MDFKIGTKRDLAGILDLYKQFNDDNDDNDDSVDCLSIDKANKIWDYIITSNIKYFIAKDGEKIVGSCYINIIPNLTHGGKSIGYIENIITDGNYRRQGIGKKLMEMAINNAKENDCYKAVLQSGIKRTGAHKFYESIGFNGTSKKAFELRF